MSTTDEMKEVFYRLMPKGKVWPVDATTTPVWDSLLGDMAKEFARLKDLLRGIVADLIPTADMGSGLLDLWEEMLDLTAQAADSTNTRVARIRAKLQENLSPSVAELQTYAEGLKASAVVTHHEYPQFIASSDCNESVRGVQWLATWTVTYDAPADTEFEAAMRAVSPQNTVLLFEVTP